MGEKGGENSLQTSHFNYLYSKDNASETLDHQEVKPKLLV